MRRSLQLVLFVTSIVWALAATALAAHAARGFSIRFQLSDAFPLIDALLLLFLLVLGFGALQSLIARNTPLRETLGLPKRASAATEWGTGAAIGWGTILFAVLPLALSGTLHIRFWTEPRSFGLALLNLATVLVASLAAELAFRGYPYRRLLQGIGPSWATLVMALLFAAIGSNADSGWQANAVTVLFGLLLCTGWLRTHGLWLSWGLHFAWIASLGVLFGFPVNGMDNLSTVVQTRAIGPTWLTGGDLGPEGALLTLLFLLAAIAVLIRSSRDWAWHYTHKPIIPGGYAMDVRPPATHTAMEQAPKPPTLVQILPSTPQTRSVDVDSDPR